MDYETLRFEIKDNVATITLNQPEKLNALRLQSVVDIRAALKQVIVAREAKVLLLTGTGRGFCPGVDIKALDVDVDPEDRDELLRDHFAPTFGLLKELGIPTIAAVNGPCAGAGTSLALSCDIVLAARSAYFVQAFVNLGLVPDTGASWFVTRALGVPRATALLMLGEKLPAETAAEWGLIWKCVDDDRLMAAAGAIAEKLAAGPSVAYRMIKSLVRAASANSLRDQILLESEYQTAARKTEDHTEARTAFEAKRVPVFKGR